jgi:hypothetical protein
MFAEGSAMAEKSSSTVPIIVAVIGVAGTIAATLIANWDKISSSRVPSGPTAPAQVADHSASAVQPASDHAPPETIVTGASAVEVGGTWGDGEGHTYIFEQNGSSYSFRQFKNGAVVGSGHGTLDGRNFRHDFTSVYGDGSCHGQVSLDGQNSSGTCQIDGGQPYDMAVYRSAAAAKG